MITILMRSGTSIHTNLTVKELEDRIFNCGLHAECLIKTNNSEVPLINPQEICEIRTI